MSATGKGRKRDALTQGVQDRVVLLIEEWKEEWGAFSASALERKVASCLGIRCTRQGLLKKDAIKTAFDRRKAKAGKPANSKSAEAVVLEQRIKRLEQLLAEKTAQVEQLQEMVIRFRHNAKLMGFPADRLERPIAPLISHTENSA
ncbi:hypothetical protein ACIGGE_07820 [Qipengyuania sp. NPDC077410]|jgi:hypothetical protein|uniref:hypothetical protein n=1 Tax=Qipengyuania sp. NPDC077410 TaxID=3364496 RepID=UPI0037C61C86